MRLSRRRLWTWSLTTAAGLLVVAALVTGAFRAAVLVVPSYKQEVEAYAAKVLNRPLEIGQMELTWRGARPTLQLSDVYLLSAGGGTASMELERLELGFALPRVLQGQTTPSHINLVGALIEVERDQEGAITVKGLGGGDGGGDLTQRLAELARVRVSEASLVWSDRKLGLPAYWFREVDLHLARTGDVLEMAMSADMPQAMGGTGHLSLKLLGDLAGPNWTADGDFLVDGVQPGPWVDAWAGRALALGGDPVQLSGNFTAGAQVPLALSGNIRTRALWHGTPAAGVESMAADVRVTNQQGAWTLTLGPLAVDARGTSWNAQALTLVASSTEAGPVFELSADRIQLQDVLHWLVLTVPQLAEQTAWLAGGTGELTDVSARIAGLGRPQPAYAASARFSGLGLADLVAGSSRDPEQAVEMSGLQGTVQLNQAGGTAQLESKGFSLTLPGVFEAPLALTSLTAPLRWARDERAWVLQADGFEASGYAGHFGGTLSLTLPDQGGPGIDLRADLQSTDATRFKALVPLRWHPNLRRWIKRAVQAGQVPAGQIRVAGPLSGIPYHRVPGTFQIGLTLADADLAYSPDWPAITQVHGRLEIDRTSLEVQTVSAQTEGIQIRKARARIDDFAEPVLVVSAEAGSGIGKMLDFVPRSPLRKPLGPLHSRMTATGGAELTLALNIPLKRWRQGTYDGSLTLSHADVTLDQVAVLEGPVRDVHGSITFNQTGARATDLRGLARIDGHDLPVTVAFNPVPDTPALTQVRVDTDLTFGRASDLVGSRLSPDLRARFGGTSTWTTAFQVGRDAPREITLRTQFHGTTIDIPAPLAKPTATADYPVLLKLNPAGDGVTDIAGWVGPRLALRLTRDAQGRIAAANIRAGQPGAVQPPPVWRAGKSGATGHLEGALQALDLPAWFGVLADASNSAADQQSDGGPAALPERWDLNIDVDALEFGGATFADQRVEGVVGAGAVDVTLAGAANGTVNWAASDAPVRVRLVRVRTEPLPWQTQAAAQGGAGAAAPAPRRDTNEEPTEPGTWPALDIRIDDLVLGDLALGSVALLASQRPAGLALDTLALDGPYLDGGASGYWVRTGGVTRAALNGGFSSPNVNTLMQGLGVTPNIDASSARATVDFAWPESAKGLDWTRANGTLDVSLDDGVISAVEPGAGRMLGLFSFNALPRRLVGDFRDVTDQGLAFDRVRGHFLLSGGQAETDDLLVETASVDVAVRGRVDLQNRSYDQTITVYPQVSAGITLAGTVFGGPAVGAILLVAQALMDQPLNQASQLSYHLGGSWESPQVSRVVSPALADAPGRGIGPDRNRGSGQTTDDAPGARADSGPRS